MVYLDSAATTFPHQDCLDMFNDCMVNYYNPSSTYCEAGRNAKVDIDAARLNIAEYINASPEEIYFTSSGSEANTWAIRGLVEANDIDIIITTKIEHSSVWNTINYISRNNTDAVHRYQTCHVEYVDILKNGLVRLSHLRELLKKWEGYKILVAIMYANNEIGIIQNIHMLSLITHLSSKNAWFFTDAVQAFGNVNIDMKLLEFVDAMSVSGHKFGVMSGIGFLYLKKGTKISPLIFGGNQERHLRGGTENYGYINALGYRVYFLNCEKNTISREILHKKKLYLKECIDKNLHKQKAIWYYNDDSERSLDHIISLTIKGVNAQQLISLLEMNGFIISAGSACNSGNNEPSRVLKAIGLSDEDARSTIRICPNIDIKDIEIEEFAKVLGISTGILMETNDEKVDVDEK